MKWSIHIGVKRCCSVISHPPLHTPQQPWWHASMAAEDSSSQHWVQLLNFRSNLYLICFLHPSFPLSFLPLVYFDPPLPSDIPAVFFYILLYTVFKLLLCLTTVFGLLFGFVCLDIINYVHLRSSSCLSQCNSVKLLACREKPQRKTWVYESYFCPLVE